MSSIEHILSTIRRTIDRAFELSRLLDSVPLSDLDGFAIYFHRFCNSLITLESLTGGHGEEFLVGGRITSHYADILAHSQRLIESTIDVVSDYGRDLPLDLQVASRAKPNNSRRDVVRGIRIPRSRIVELKSQIESVIERVEYLISIKRSGVYDQDLLMRESGKSKGGLLQVLEKSGIVEVALDPPRRTMVDALVRGISVGDHSRRHQGIKSTRLASTGFWFTESSEFTQWVRGKGDKTGRVLLCQGIPGAGKSVLTSLVIDQLTTQFQDNPTVGLTYAYFNPDLDSKLTLHDALSVLLGQMLLLALEGRGVSSDVSARLAKFYDGSFKPSLSSLLDLFEEAIRSLPDGQIFVVLDGIDALSFDISSDLLGYMHRFMERFSALKLYVSSNWGIEHQFKEQFDSYTSLEIRAHDDDLVSYLRHRIESPPSLVDRLTAKVLNMILASGKSATCGMFSLAVWYMDHIRNLRTVSAINEYVSHVSRCGFDDARVLEVWQRPARETFSKTPAEVDMAVSSLKWAMWSLRPMKNFEFGIAVAISTNLIDLDNPDEYIVPGATPATIISANCAGLVIESRDGTVRLAHPSVRKFMGDTESHRFQNTAEVLTKTCLTYLASRTFSSGPCASEAELKGRLKSNPFYDYAATFWGRHAVDVEGEELQLVQKFLRDQPKVAAAAQVLLASDDTPWSSDNPSQQVTGMHLAAHFGLSKSIASLHRDNDQLCISKDKYDRTPLIWAARSGHQGGVSKLLEILSSEDRSHQDADGRTALWHAASNGHGEVVDYLLQHGLDVNLPDMEGRTPISGAAGRGHESVVEKLLMHINADAFMMDSHARTPLWHASANGHFLTVAVLLKIGAYPHDRDGEHAASPIVIAAQNGHHQVVNILIEKSDMIWSEKEFSKLIDVAATNNHEAVVATLFNKLRELEGEESLSSDDVWRWAIEKGMLTVLNMLVSDPGSLRRDVGGGRTVLTLAAERGQDKVVRSLLGREYAHDLNLVAEQDAGGRLPLSLAAEHGHGSTVLVLMREFSANPILADRGGQLPIFHAANARHFGVVWLMLDHGKIDPYDCYDCEGRSLLSIVAEFGDVSIIQHLISRFPDYLNREDDGAKRTILSWAAGGGNIRIVDHLLRLDGPQVELETKDNADGRTPLFWAVRNGHEECAQRLIDKGAAMAGCDGMGRTALHLAALSGNEAVVSLMLSQPDIYVSALDKEGKTALQLVLEEETRQEPVLRRLATNDRTTLHILAKRGTTGYVKTLKEAGYKINVVDFWVGTPLHEAIRSSSEEDVNVLKELAEGGADVNVRDNSSVSPLQLAIKLKKQAAAKILLRHGSEVVGISASELRHALFGTEDRGGVLMVSEIAGHSGGYEVTLNPSDFPWPAMPAAGGPELAIRRLCQRDRGSLPPWKMPDTGSDGLLCYCAKEYPSGVELVYEYYGDAWFGRRVFSNRDETHLDPWRCSIGWTLHGHAEDPDNPTWRTVDHFSAMPHASIPNDGFEFFEQFLAHIEKKWRSLCEEAQNSLMVLRKDILDKRGDDENIIIDLLDHARLWAELRHALTLQVDSAREFIRSYSERCQQPPSPSVNRRVKEMEPVIHGQIDRIDGVIQDLIQIEFNLVSIKEARLSTTMSQSMKRLTWITFIFLPLTFVSGLFGMNVDVLSDNPPWWYYAAFATPIMLITSSLWIGFKRYDWEKQLSERFAWLLTRKPKAMTTVSASRRPPDEETGVKKP